MFNPLIAALRLAAFVAVTLLLLPPYLATAAAGRQAQMRFAGAYWRGVVRLFGFRLRVWGTPLAKGPALLVASHTSYFDIIVLNSLLPAFFVAKSEVADGPASASSPASPIRCSSTASVAPPCANATTCAGGSMAATC